MQPRADPRTTSWAMRAYEAADEVVWAIELTALWAVFTLAGGVVAGVGPATVAAYTVARRRASGEVFAGWSAFTAAFRRGFGRGSALVLPLAVVAVLLVTNYFSFASLGSAGTPGRLATLAALAALAVIASYLLPMLVHFDLRFRDCLPKASLFALTRPAPSVLLLFVLVAIGYTVAAYPFLVVAAVGGWIQLNTWLCLRFFAENEARLRARGLR